MSPFWRGGMHFLPLSHAVLLHLFSREVALGNTTLSNFVEAFIKDCKLHAQLLTFLTSNFQIWIPLFLLSAGRTCTFENDQISYENKKLLSIMSVTRMISETAGKGIDNLDAETRSPKGDLLLFSLPRIPLLTAKIFHAFCLNRPIRVCAEASFHKMLWFILLGNGFWI